MATVNPTTLVQSHWKSFLIEGILLALLGIVAIAVPPAATFTIELIIGWTILFSGIAGIIATFRTRGSPGFGWSLFSAVLALITGGVLLMWPLSGVLTLTLVLSAYLTIEGIASIMYALAHRRQQTPRWGFMLFSGLIDLLLSAVIFWGFPGTAAWVIGLVVGSNMIFGGTALVAIALQARANAAPNKPTLATA